LLLLLNDFMTERCALSGDRIFRGEPRFIYLNLLESDSARGRRPGSSPTSQSRCTACRMLAAPVHFSPVTDFDHSNDEYIVLDLVNDTVDSLAHPISILT